MKTLKEILKGISSVQIIGSTDIAIQKIAFDSRQIESKDVFVAQKGTQVDGHQYIEKAIEKGAKVIVCEKTPTLLHPDCTYVVVENTNAALGLLAANYYDHPSKKLKLVGITGTNGKTTTATLLYDLMLGLGYKAGLISTVSYKIHKTTIASSHTTPNAISVNQLLADMVTAGCAYAFMEVSSHAIDQCRIDGLYFTGGVFTNISHDHLDYHKTFKAYIYTKKKFFDELDKSAFALSNLDDKQGLIMLQNTKARKVGYSLHQLTDYKGKIIENNLAGLHLSINNTDFYSQLIGDFNAYNLLAAYAVAIQLGQDKTQVLTALSLLKSAEGRFEYIVHPNQSVIGIIDYAHTPDALEKVLITIQALKQDTATQVISVVGCGGDRDKTKRPKMARIASLNSDLTILTSDNPRSESPQQIIDEMEKGVPIHRQPKVLSIIDRKQAIKTACQLVQQKAVILVAGKGHEKYQEINGVKHPFDDKVILKDFFNTIKRDS